MVLIRFANLSDKHAIKVFIDQHWKKNHILVTSDEIFEWQYVDDGKLNFVISEQDSVILGLLGFIENKGFDPLLSSATVWLALWKVNEALAAPATGIKLLRYLEQNLELDLIGTLGISDIAKRIYIALGYKVGELDHFYVGSSNLSEALVSNMTLPFKYLSVEGESLIETDGFTSDIVCNDAQYPSKSRRFLIAKYQMNPFYRYKFLLFQCDTKAVILVGRVINICATKVLRIVDVCGAIDLLLKVAPPLQEYINKNGMEYADLQIFSELIDLSNSQFEKVSDDSGVCIPQYFEPYEKRNAKIGFAFKTDSSKPVTLFKADADQERPNFLCGGDK
jgi:hypothetical protein